MNYEDYIKYLFSQLAVYQRDGASAYKPGLQTSLTLSQAFSNPHNSFKSIHIAGTNGKGSTAHTLAAILQSAGYKTGLYTSPHLVDFRERIRVNGEKITKKGVVDFMNRYFNLGLNLKPSFFELTMMMAFDWFRSRDVDVAVIETGLGGRLDSTNIISPVLSVITNISFDHTALLGHTLPEIASEKAGIIKPNTPVVVGEAEGDVLEVFVRKANETNSSLILPANNPEIINVETNNLSQRYFTRSFGIIDAQLTGECQTKNAETILAAVKLLCQKGFDITADNIGNGFASVCSLTGLMGRWMVLGTEPMIVADTGHNAAGWEYIEKRLNSIPGTKRLVLGFVNDKDITTILSHVARIDDSLLYATMPQINRGLDCGALADKARSVGINVVNVTKLVVEGYKKALADAGESDILFVGGSNFVVADLLENLNF